MTTSRLGCLYLKAELFVKPSPKIENSTILYAVKEVGRCELVNHSY